MKKIAKTTKNIRIYFLHGNNRNLSFYLKEMYRKDVEMFHVDKSKMTEDIDSGAIFLLKEPLEEPDWTKAIYDLARPTKRKEIEDLLNTEDTTYVDKGLMILRVNCDRKRCFAISFGRGFHLLDTSSIVSDFGIEVAKSLLSERDIFSIGSTLVDKRIFKTERQSTEYLLPERLIEYGSHNIVSNVYGAYQDDETGIKVTVGGKESLNFRGKINLKEDLSFWLKKFFMNYQGEERKLDISGELKTVDGDLKEHLDMRLSSKILAIIMPDKSITTRINEKEVYKIKISPNTTFDLDKLDNFIGYYVGGIGYRKTKSDSDFSIDEVNYFEKLQMILKERQFNTQEILKKIKRDKIQIKCGFKDDAGDLVTGFEEICSVYQAMNFETVHEKNKYILVAGRWFEIDRDYYRKLKEDIDAIKDASSSSFEINYIKFKENSHDGEGGYNQAFSEENQLLNLDKRNYTPGSEILKEYGLKTRSAIEICDVIKFDDECIQFIHVKRHTGASGISHLLMQALVSANVYLSEYEKVLEHISSEVSEFNSAATSPYRINPPEESQGIERRKEIVLVIIEEKQRVSNTNSKLLSLLEMISVTENLRTFNYWGFKCYIQFIEAEK